MLTIDSNVFSKFIKKLTLEKMITEVTFEYKNEVLNVLTCDSLHQLIIDGTCKVLNNDEPSKPFMFTVGLIKEFHEKVKTLDGIISLEVVDNVLKIKSVDKELKLGIISSSLYSGIQSVYMKDIRSNSISVSIRSNNVVYTDFVNCTGKELKGYIDQCKIVESNAYLLTQLDGKLQLTSDNSIKKDSVKIQVNMSNTFKTDKTYWIYNFVKYILSNNPESLNVYLERTIDPMVIHTKDDNYEILYILAPK